MVPFHRPWWPCLILVAETAGLIGCGTHNSARSERPLPSRSARIDRALSAAAQFLSARQSPDGAWRSETYSAFRDGASLTPLVLQALLAVPMQEAFAPVSDQGIAYLAGLVQPDGRSAARPQGLNYPVYTAALAVRALSQHRHPGSRQAQAAWLAYLRARQLTEELGWQ